NRGLNPHIEDVTRRIALEGVLAFAPDGLSTLGGTPEDSDKAREMFQQLDAQKSIRNFGDGFTYIKSRKDCTGKYGGVGFSWGAARANSRAAHDPHVRAAVPYYGRQADVNDVPKIKAAIQLHYAGEDDRINAGITAYEEAWKKAGIDYQRYIYEG